MSLRNYLLAVCMLLVVCIGTPYSQETAPNEAQELDLALRSIKNGGTWNHAGEKGKGRKTAKAELVAKVLSHLRDQGHAQRVVISNAIIQGDLILRSETYGCDITFQDVDFTGGLDFRDARFKQNLELTSCVFHNTCQFQGSSVGGNLAIEKSTFHKGFMFSRMTIEGILDADGIISLGKSTFYNAVIKRSAFLENATFKENLNLRSSRIGIDLDISKAAFEKTLDLRYAHVDGAIFIRETQLKAEQDACWIRGLKYRHLTNEPQTSGAIGGSNVLQVSPLPLIDFIDKADFSRDAYLELEQHLKSMGDHSAANEVFFRLKQRERKLLPWYGKLWSYFLEGTVGHGRRPWLALAWSVGVILLGCYVFRPGPKSMELVDRSKPVSPPRYGRFWCILYSFDLFVPAINFGAATIWRPHPQRGTLVHAYVRVQRLLGWILVPIGVAALSGLLGTK